MYDLTDRVRDIWAESDTREEFIDKMSNICDVPQDTLVAMSTLLESGIAPVDAVDQSITHFEREMDAIYLTRTWI